MSAGSRIGSNGATAGLLAELVLFSVPCPCHEEEALELPAGDDGVVLCDGTGVVGDGRDRFVVVTSAPEGTGRRSASLDTTGDGYLDEGPRLDRDLSV